MSESVQTEEPDKNETEGARSLLARSLFGRTKHVPAKSGFKHVGPSYGACDM